MWYMALKQFHGYFKYIKSNILVYVLPSGRCSSDEIIYFGSETLQCGRSEICGEISTVESGLCAMLMITCNHTLDHYIKFCNTQALAKKTGRSKLS